MARAALRLPASRPASLARCLGCVAVLLTATATTTAEADWPMARQNPRRTAAVDGTSNISAPTPFWRYYTGGWINGERAIAMDLKIGGPPEVLMVSGGRVTAKDVSSGDTIWETDQIEAFSLVALQDMDGDGVAELVAQSESRVFLLRPSDGAILWAEPEGEMGRIGGVRVDDFNGDGSYDLLIQECGCCSVNSGNPGFVYRFGGGGGATLAQPVLMWELTEPSCGGHHSGAIVSLRSAGQREFVQGANDHLKLLDAASGQELAVSENLGQRMQVADCQPIAVPGGAADELLCVRNDPAAAPGIGHRVYLFRYTAAGLETVWFQDVGELDGGMAVPPSMVRDLDGDGTPEIMLTGTNVDGSRDAVVLDSLNGSVIGTAPGRFVTGVSGPLANGRRFLLTGGNDDAMQGHSYDGSQLQAAFGLPDREALSEPDWAQRGAALQFRQTLLFDVTGDGVDELLLRSVDTPRELYAYELSGTSASPVAQYTAPEDTAVLSGWHFRSQQGGSQQDGASSLGIAQSDGNMHVLDSNWQVESGNKSFGARFGGFFSPGSFRQLRATPVIGDLQDGGPPGLLVQTSRATLERLDATEATFADGPTSVWSTKELVGAIVVPGLADGAPGIVGIDWYRDAQRHDVVALDTAGGERWRTQLPGLTLADLVIGDVDGDGDPDIVADGGDALEQLEQVHALDGDSGALLWSSTPYGPFNRQPAGGAVADWNGDGLDDYVYHADATRVLSGADGSEIAAGAEGWSYFMPLIADTDEDGEDEICLHAGFQPASSLDHDLSTQLWQSPEDDRPMTYAALAQCPGSPPLLVGGSWQFPSRLKITQTAGANAGSATTLVLADGQRFGSIDQAVAAGAARGQLASPVVHQNLAGDGKPVVVVGSSDGWLYGVDPCTSLLRWSRDLGSPIGSVIFGDSDADGLDEILVSVADGYLYAMKQSDTVAVTKVLDIDIPRGITDEDVDLIETESTLYARWLPAAGVDGYEVGVVRDPKDGGGFITVGPNGPWISVGNDTTATLADLPLEDGKRYFAVVRSVKDGVVSPDTLSDGVVVLIEPTVQETGGPVWLVGRSCVYFCAASPQHTPNTPWFGFLTVGLLVAWRRRSRVA